MVPVNHGGYAVKAETVYVVLLHPVFDVGKEEIAGGVLAVVEAPGAPSRVVSLRACVEVKVIRAVKKGQAFVRVLDAMAVDDVHDYGNALAVGVVYQCLEFIRGAEAGTQGKEIGHLIAEGAVIGMLLQSHDLDGVVAEFLNARKDIPAEFLEGAHFLLFCCHADVALVDEGMTTRVA